MLTQLARHGLGVRPDYSFARVLDGFSAALDPRAVALLEHNPEVAGVYPVRAAYPAAVSASTLARGGRASPGVALPGFDGAGITIALLDTGVDLTHPYLGGTGRAGDRHRRRDRRRRGRSANPQHRRQIERHGTELAGVLVGSGGPGGVHGVAPGASVLPIRVAGWQPTASGRDAVYARSDQLIAGLDRAVDPNGDGDTHDAARIALIGVAEPFASFADSPEAQAVDGRARARHARRRAGRQRRRRRAALRLDRRARPARPARSRSARPTRARRPRPSASSSARGSPCSPTATLPLLGTVAPGAAARRCALAAPGGPGALRGQGGARRRPGANPARHGERRGRATVPRPCSSTAAGCRRARSAIAAVPVRRELPARRARSARRAGRARFTVVVAIGRAATDAERGRRPRRDVLVARSHLRRAARAAARGARASAIATSDPGAAGDGEPAFADRDRHERRRRRRRRRRRPARAGASRPRRRRPREPARRLGAARRRGVDGGGAGVVDPGASAAGEVAASQTVARLRPVARAALAPDASGSPSTTSRAARSRSRLSSSSRPRRRSSRRALELARRPARRRSR